ncbi:MAG: sigma-70 family RNA polymerase sigma factor [Saprospiraceae bacterium]|nr:sigma-70 family RNA polymerase sigma factor [Saprospiraceae bacterium]
MTDEDILHLLKDPRTLERGFRMLMVKYQERLYWHVRRMVRDHDDADDVIQNTFVKVYKGLPRFKEKAKLYTWMYRIATNEAITFLNQRKRRATTSLQNEELNLTERLEADVFFDGAAATAKLVRAIEMLPEKQRAVFNLRYYDEMSYRDMSEVLQTSVGALKASYHHAVKKIEAFFKGAEV